MDHNLVGKRGENIFAALIMEPWDRTESFFDPYFLGDKFPTVDHYVELVGANARYYFFVQVRSTPQGYETINGKKRLKVKVSKKEVDRLVAFPAPTYVVGIDEKAWKAYLLSVNESRNAITTFPTTFPLTRVNLQRLWTEVQIFWSKRDLALKNSYFME